MNIQTHQPNDIYFSQRITQVESLSRFKIPLEMFVITITCGLETLG